MALYLARNVSLIDDVVSTPLSFKSSLLKVSTKHSSCIFDYGWNGTYVHVECIGRNWKILLLNLLVSFSETKVSCPTNLLKIQNGFLRDDVSQGENFGSLTVGSNTHKK